MKLQTKTYITDTQYDIDGNVTFQREFSDGEYLTEEDLQLIEDRSTTFYVDSNDDIEEYYSCYIPVANVVPEEFNQFGTDTFQIGNNVRGGI